MEKLPGCRIIHPDAGGGLPPVYLSGIGQETCTKQAHVCIVGMTVEYGIKPACFDSFPGDGGEVAEE